MSRFDGIIPNGIPSMMNDLSEAFQSIHDKVSVTPSLMQEKEEDKPEKKGKRKRKGKAMEDLTEMESVDDITPSLEPEETDFEMAASLLQLYPDHTENLKKTQNPKLDSKRQLVSSVKECKKRKQMEVDDSQRTLITYTRRCKNNVPENPPRRIVMRDSYEVGECSEPVRKTRKQMEVDDSEETLGIMVRWKDRTVNMNNPPRRMFEHNSEALGRCSKPVRKQVMESDVKKDQCRLMLGKEHVKKMMEEVLGKVENPGDKGRKVLVYGPNGKIFEMSFKMWNGDTPVLTSSEWTKFVKEYGIEPSCDFLTIWMFRHQQQTDQLCFAINFDRFCVNAKLSKRILKDAGF